MKLKDRAETIEQKRDILSRILTVWMQYPEMRLGQLIDNARFNKISTLFNVEDYKLVDELENFNPTKYQTIELTKTNEKK